ncbi:MAG: hypothetical protein ACOC0Q_01415 [Wenzhouxiangella sp.]
MNTFWTEYTLMLAGNILISLILIPVCVLALFLSLRVRDRIAGISWPAMRGKILGTPTGAALYAAGWVIGVSLIIASAIR